MSKHTEGPWHINEHDLELNKYGVYGMDVSGKSIDNIVTVWGTTEAIDDEAKANARLIAAAPEMFDLLVEFANQTQPDVKKFQQHSLDLLTRINQ